jgi:hypothetical protein
MLTFELFSPAPPKSFISIIFALRFHYADARFSAAIFRGWLLAFAISTVIFADIASMYCRHYIFH